MVRHASLFSQLIALFDRKKFYQLVYRHHSERYAKRFTSWDRFVAMLFCQLAQAKSLREICGGLLQDPGRLPYTTVMPRVKAKSRLQKTGTCLPGPFPVEIDIQTLAV